MTEEFYTVAQLAQEFGITPRAIRLYESKGLISSSRVGRTMIYSRKQRARLKIVLRSKRIGFSLDDVKEYLDLYDAGKTNPNFLLRTLHTCHTRLSELKAQQKALEETIDELEGVEQSARTQLSTFEEDVEQAYSDYLQNLPKK